MDTAFKKLSEADKLAQLQGIRPNDLMEGGKLSVEKCKQLIPHGVGHLCQYSSSLSLSPDGLRNFVRELQNYLLTQTPGGVPAIFHEEALTGCPTLGATTFPQHIGIGCTWNPELAEQKTRFTAETMRKAGATQALSPMVDICRSAHWSRMEESLGEDAYLTSSLGLAFIKGLQGDDLRTGIAATSKHFAGYGGENENKKEFMEEVLMPHEVGIKLGGVRSIMPGYHSYNGMRCIANKELLTDILRNQLGFDGLIVSDYGAVYGLVRGHFVSDEKAAAAKAINAGADVELSAGKCFPFLPAAIKEGAVSQEAFDTAVKRVLDLKARLGLLDEHPETAKDEHLDFDPPAHRQLAYEAACQSLVLLKNNGILPLKKGTRKIAMLGPNAASYLCLFGDYTYQALSAFWWNIPVNPESPKLVSLYDGLKSKVGGEVTLLYERGCDWSKPTEAKIDTKAHADSRLEKVKMMVFKDLPKADPEKALQIAAESDVIIAAMGENLYLCGEGREREGIKLPGDQEAFVQKLLATGKPVILVMFGGRPQVIDQLEPKCAAVIQAWFPGEEGGNAVADLLLGNINPSGKLCVSYPKTDEKKMLCYNQGYTGENVPMYPFGYGLSYTQYAYSGIKIPSEARTSDAWIPVSFKVKNTGERAGTEIVQLYISPKGLSVPGKPIQLKGFQRVALGKGEEKEVVFQISPQQLAYYHEGVWVIEPGKYEIMAAASSTDIRLAGTVELQGGKKTLKSRSVFFSLTK